MGLGRRGSRSRHRKDSLDILVEGVPSGMSLDEIEQALLAVPGVVGTPRPAFPGARADTPPVQIEATACEIMHAHGDAHYAADSHRHCARSRPLTGQMRIPTICADSRAV